MSAGYAVLGPSETNDSEEDIEMINMEEVLEKNHDQPPPYEPEPVSDYGFDSPDEEAQSALLGQRSNEEEDDDDLPRRPVKVWRQVRGIVIETGPTLALTTVSLLFTGKLLDRVSHWPAMVEVDQLIMIIPVILNLKGNLEMNLSARLGTAANVGDLDKSDVRRQIIIGNLTLLQVQAAVVSFVAACVSLILGLVIPHFVTPKSTHSAPSALSNSTVNATIPAIRSLYTFALETRARHPLPHPVERIRRSGVREFVMVASTAMSAACLSSFALGSFMCFLVVACRHFGLDPDNIAPPIASCLGDLVTLILMGISSGILLLLINTPIPLIICIAIVVFAFVCAGLTFRNPHVKELLKQGWTPLFGAMAISSGTGIVLDLYVGRYKGFALLAVVISGLPGSVGSIFVSRLSTALHAAALAISSLPLPGGKASQHQPSARLVGITLILVTLPVEIAFLAVLRGLGWLQLPMLFIGFSVVFFCVAVTVSLLLARFLTNVLWSWNCDPDMYALPIHSALMDLIGQLLLVLCFEIVEKLGATVAAKRPSSG